MESFPFVLGAVVRTLQGTKGGAVEVFQVAWEAVERTRQRGTAPSAGAGATLRAVAAAKAGVGARPEVSRWSAALCNDAVFVLGAGTWAAASRVSTLMVGAAFRSGGPVVEGNSGGG